MRAFCRGGNPAVRWDKKRSLKKTEKMDGPTREKRAAAVFTALREPTRLRFVRIQEKKKKEKKSWKGVQRGTSSGPLWSWKLAYSLLHFLQRLSSPGSHARPAKISHQYAGRSSKENKKIKWKERKMWSGYDPRKEEDQLWAERNG